MNRQRGYNGLKLETLRIFAERGGWITPGAWSVLARFYPIRAAYSYLGKLWRFGLLNRRRDDRGLVVYRISRRGRTRLSWLEQQVANGELGR